MGSPWVHESDLRGKGLTKAPAAGLQLAIHFRSCLQSKMRPLLLMSRRSHVCLLALPSSLEPQNADLGKLGCLLCLWVVVGPHIGSTVAELPAVVHGLGLGAFAGDCGQPEQEVVCRKVRVDLSFCGENTSGGNFEWDLAVLFVVTFQKRSRVLSSVSSHKQPCLETACQTVCVKAWLPMKRGRDGLSVRWEAWAVLCGHRGTVAGILRGTA